MKTKYVNIEIEGFKKRLMVIWSMIISGKFTLIEPDLIKEKGVGR